MVTFLQVDSDGDGYLSCFQVLLALKEIIPPELLTEEEEIYVYRVLTSILNIITFTTLTPYDNGRAGVVSITFNSI